MDSDIPYLLLTPGPLSTSRTVRQAMRTDYSTWDIDYNTIVQDVRRRLVRLAVGDASAGDGYTCVLMQGSGTFCVEATLGAVIPPQGKVLIVDNGAYGRRMVLMAERLKIAHVVIEHSEVEPANLERIDRALRADGAITHLAMVHCETTTGLLNPAREAGALAARHGKTFILDAMSSFGGIPFTMPEVGAQFLVSSANKCIQGVPGFGFVLASRPALEATRGWARSLSLDLWDQWREMEEKGGKWRYTSPTHSVLAFAQALTELEQEGGVAARHQRYRTNQQVLARGMRRLGFRVLIPEEIQSPIITSFFYPEHPNFTFQAFYDKLKARRFVVYHGKVSHAPCFRIANIGHVFPEDMELLLARMAEVMEEMGIPAAPAAVSPVVA